MAGRFILLGEKNARGGTVIEASSEISIGDVGVAQLGDDEACLIPGHDVNLSVFRDCQLRFDGKPIARMGDVVSCATTLIPSQMLTTEKA